MVIASAGGGETHDHLADRIVAELPEDDPGAVIRAMHEFREATGASLRDARNAIERAYERKREGGRTA